MSAEVITVVRTETVPDVPGAILDIATELFWKQGFAATTTRQIAAAAGMRQASLYYHIACKEDLIYQIVRASLNDIDSSVSNALQAKTDPLERVRCLIHAHLLALLKDQKRNLVVLTEILLIHGTRGAAIRALRAKYSRLVRGVLEDAQLAGALRSDIPAGQLSLALLNLLNWTSLWYRPNGSISPTGLGNVFGQIFLEGVVEASGRQRGLAPFVWPQSKTAPDSIPADTKHRLQQTASSLFAQRGYETTSMREVAEALGVRKASLYYHVSRKEDLLFEIATSALQTITQDVETALENCVHPLDRVAVMIQAHVGSLLRHSEMHMAGRSSMRALSPARRAQVQALRDRHEQLVAAQLDAAQKSGYIRADIDSKTLRLALLSLLNRTEIWFRPGGELTMESVGRMLAEIFLLGVANPSHP
jgi:TetR/AcrR family transcriptional regulator, cholesterol catabolism regulator